MTKSTGTMTENQCIINIANSSTELAKKWVSEVKNKLENLTGTCSMESERWKKQSIYKVPRSVTELCVKAYKPQTVSIGAYHHGEEQLKGMEEHKERALLHFLKRSGKPLEWYVDTLNQSGLEHLKDAYDQLDDKWKYDTEAFLKLMIVDGCFILELMRTTTAEEEELKKMEYAENDPVFSNHGRLYIVPYLKRDMLMLENQLPMLVLTTLLAIEKGMQMGNNLSQAQGEVNELILKFFSQPHNISNMECSHILDVYRKSLLVDPVKRQNGTKKSSSDGGKGKAKGKDQGPDAYIIRSATELNEAGIKIIKSKTKSLKDISFHKGVLNLPLIVVDDSLQSQYLNLMAFERLHVGAGSEVTSYVFFMDSIIDSAVDVSLLHWSGVIQNALGSDKAVANLFNSLSKDVTLDPKSSLDSVHKQVSKYCRKLLPRWIAFAKHNYFTNPWAGISVIAAIFLFALSGLQSYYDVLGYYDSKN